jgi:hypothetical protein
MLSSIQISTRVSCDRFSIFLNVTKNNEIFVFCFKQSVVICLLLCERCVLFFVGLFCSR